MIFINDQFVDLTLVEKIIKKEINVGVYKM